MISDSLRARIGGLTFWGPPADGTLEYRAAAAIDALVDALIETMEIASRNEVGPYMQRAQRALSIAAESNPEGERQDRVRECIAHLSKANR